MVTPIMMLPVSKKVSRKTGISGWRPSDTCATVLRDVTLRLTITDVRQRWEFRRLGNPSKTLTAGLKTEAALSSWEVGQGRLGVLDPNKLAVLELEGVLSFAWWVREDGCDRLQLVTAFVGRSRDLPHNDQPDASQGFQGPGLRTEFPVAGGNRILRSVSGKLDRGDFGDATDLLLRNFAKGGHVPAAFIVIVDKHRLAGSEAPDGVDLASLIDNGEKRDGLGFAEDQPTRHFGELVFELGDPIGDGVHQFGFAFDQFDEAGPFESYELLFDTAQQRHVLIAKRWVIEPGRERETWRSGGVFSDAVFR
jgi:hypothetical protein